MSAPIRWLVRQRFRLSNVIEHQPRSIVVIERSVSPVALPS